MTKYEVTCDLVITTKVKIVVEADSASDAIDEARGLLPANYDPDASAEWKAKVSLTKKPKGVEVTGVRAVHFSSAQGGEKTRRVGG